MAVEKQRGCGYRKVGGLYMVCNGAGRSCGRLPFPLKTCPTCGGGIKLTRSVQFMKAKALLAHAPKCKTPKDCKGCPLNELKEETIGLMTVGERHYTPSTFTFEASHMGISKRISAIPKQLKIGETWIFLGHKEAAIDGLNKVPGVFHVFRPQRIELIVDSKIKNKAWVKNYAKKGVTLVEVPVDDPDHHAGKKKKRR